MSQPKPREQNLAHCSNETSVSTILSTLSFNSESLIPFPNVSTRLGNRWYLWASPKLRKRYFCSFCHLTKYYWKYLSIHFHLGEHFLLVVETMLSKPATPAVTSTLATKETLEEVLVAGIGIETCVHMVVKGGSCLSDSKVSHSIDLEMQSFLLWDDELTI